MITLDADQQRVVDSTVIKSVDWLFEVTDSAGPTTYYWSTKDVTVGAQPYTFKVMNFSGLNLRRYGPQSRVVAPGSFSFTVSNDGNTLTASNFVDGTLELTLRATDDTGSENIITYKFNIRKAESYYQKVTFTCEDFLQAKLRGAEYPNTKLIKDCFPSNDPNNDNVCVPITIGTAYIPIRSVYVPEDFSSSSSVSSSSSSESSSSSSESSAPSSSSSSESSSSHSSSSSSSESSSSSSSSSQSSSSSHSSSSSSESSSSSSQSSSSSGAIAVDKRYYLLGPFSGSYYYYNVDKVRSPRAWGAKSEWEGEDYDLNQWTAADINGDNYRLLDPIIADSDADGIVDAGGLWRQGDSFLDMPTKFSRDLTKYMSGDVLSGTHDGGNGMSYLDSSDLAAFGVLSNNLANHYIVNVTDGSYARITTNSGGLAAGTLEGGTDNDWDNGDEFIIGGPATVIRKVLLDFGVATASIDDSSFGLAEKTFASWGLVWNGGFYYKEARLQVLSRLLCMCHATISVRDKVYLNVLSKTSQLTFDKSLVLKNGDSGEGTFNYRVTLSDNPQYDSAYVAWQKADEAQDQFVKTLVPVKSNKDEPSTEVLVLPFVQDGVHIQKLGSLFFQRTLLNKGVTSFRSKFKGFSPEPNDVVTINHADYGGNYDVIVESVTLDKDLGVNYSCTLLSATLDDWADLAFADVNIVTDDTGTHLIWSPLIGGPDSVGQGPFPNQLQGRLLIGSGDNQIIVDPDDPIIRLNEGSVTRIQIGKITTDNHGIKIYDVNGDPVFIIDSSSKKIKEIEYEIYTSGVIRTSEDPSVLGGMQINNTKLIAYNENGLKLLEFIYNGADEGDAYIGDYDSGNHGIKYDHSDGKIYYRGQLVDRTPWESSQNGNFNVTVNKKYPIDTSGGIVIATLPAAPAVNDKFTWIDLTNSFSDNAFKIAVNGKKFEGDGTVTNIIIDRVNLNGTLEYTGTDYGWKFMR